MNDNDKHETANNNNSNLGSDPQISTKQFTPVDNNPAFGSSFHGFSNQQFPNQTVQHANPMPSMSLGMALSNSKESHSNADEVFRQQPINTQYSSSLSNSSRGKHSCVVIILFGSILTPIVRYHVWKLASVNRARSLIPAKSTPVLPPRPVPLSYPSSSSRSVKCLTQILGYLTYRITFS